MVSFFRLLFDQTTSHEKKFSIQVLMNEIQQEEPFTALQLFSVQPSILTSIVSTFLTYIVVLITY